MTRERGVVLIFDEVITGYRVGLDGAQERFGVMPDLTILGKALGGGFPISAVAGSADVLDVVTEGSVAHVDTFNANPVCAAAALASIQVLEDGALTIYPRLEKAAADLAATLSGVFIDRGVALHASAVPGCVTAFIGPSDEFSYENVAAADAETMRTVAERLLAAGVHVIPRGLIYVSTEHGEEERDATTAAPRTVAESMAA